MLLTEIFKPIKKHFLKAALIAAVYAAAGFFADSVLKQFFEARHLPFYKPLVLLLRLSFVSAAFALFSGCLSWKKFIPGLKFIIYSLAVWLAAIALFIPAKIMFQTAVSFAFSLALPSITAYADFIAAALSGFVFAALAFFVMFAVFDFLAKPSIDEPVLNSYAMITNNKFFISAAAVTAAVLAIIFPEVLKGRFSFLFEIPACIFLMAAYFALKSAEETKQLKTDAAVSIRL